jgi:hypothetical protein
MSSKYTLAFLTLTAVALFGAWSVDLVIARLVAVWMAIDFGLLSAAYGGGGPRLLFKQRNGLRKKWAWPVYSP